MNYKIFFYISLLCTALPTFSMAPEWLRDLSRRHEDKELLRITSTKQIEPLVGQTIACTRRKDSHLEDDALYLRIDPQSYGVFERTMTSYGYQYFLKRYRAKDGFSFETISDRGLANKNWFVRLLTLDEVRWFSSAIKAEKISPRLPANGRFTLGNLLPEEQIKYFRQRVQKNEWQRLRLLLIGQRDPGSPLHLLPRDLIRSFARFMFSAHVQELAAHTKLDDPLDLEILKLNSEDKNESQKFSNSLSALHRAANFLHG